MPLDFGHCWECSKPISGDFSVNDGVFSPGVWCDDECRTLYKKKEGGWPTFRTIIQNCPSCSAPLDSHSNTTGTGQPDPDDWSVCIVCAVFLRYNEDLSLRIATITELMEWGAEDPDTFKILLRAKEEILRLDTPRIRQYRRNAGR